MPFSAFPRRFVRPGIASSTDVTVTRPLQNSAEEMERKKERIMLMSLQRRQRADEARARAEAAAAARKAREDAAVEQKLARKEEQARRREAILQQYKLKKAIEEAEREVTPALGHCFETRQRHIFSIKSSGYPFIFHCHSAL